MAHVNTAGIGNDSSVPVNMFDSTKQLILLSDIMLSGVHCNSKNDNTVVTYIERL